MQTRLEAIRSGLSRVQADAAPDDKDIEEIARLELDRAALNNENERTLIGLRKSYGRNMIRFLWVYFVVALGLVTLSGCGWLALPESVAVALIGGTAVSVLGVVGTIVAGLFRVRSE